MPLHPQPAGHAPSAPTRPARQAFTLIELLIVIGIIVLLIGILLPIAARVRRTAQQTDTQAEIGRIATAIQAYYNDFHAYPGPIAENDIDSGTVGALSNGTAMTPALSITSSENLVLGLLGGLQAGFNGNFANSFAFVPQAVTKGPQSLNALLTAQKTTNSYLDVQPSELSPTDASGNYLAFGTTDSVVPEFLDHIPGVIIGSTNTNYNYGPILYIRARVGAGGIVTTTAAAGVQQYNFAQLGRYGFTDVSVNQNDYAIPAQPTPNPNNLPAYPDSATAYIANASQYGQPKGKDAFILISAGLDRMFGTKDDIIYGN